jgi:O-methyltransferase
MSSAWTVPGDPGEAYLELLKRVLLREVAPERWAPFRPSRRPWRRRLAGALVRILAGREAEVLRRLPADASSRREDGRDWPSEAETMIGRRRLDQLHDAVRTICRENVPGDLVETGVWRGGACIFMRGALQAYGDTTRQVWLADSFRGLPPPDPVRSPADRDDRHHRYEELSVSEAEVRGNFARYGLLDERVRFLAGWFRDTLPGAPVNALGLLRLDGDMYESTMDALEALYPRLSRGGYCIIDDFGAVPACAQAVLDFRAKRAVEEPLQEIDWTGVFWRRRA